MPQAEMVMIPSQNGRPAEYVTRREADLLFAREARNEQKQQEQVKLERERNQADCSSTNDIIEVVEATKKVHGALAGSEGSQAISASATQSPTRALFDPRRKDENEDRVKKIMEGRIPKKRKAFEDVDELFLPDHKRVKSSRKGEEDIRRSSEGLSATQEVDEASVSPGQETKASHEKKPRRVTAPKSVKKATSTAGKKRKATEAALEEKSSTKKAKTAVDDDLIIVVSAREANDALQNSETRNNNGSRSSTPIQKRKRVDDDDDDDAKHQPKKVKSGVPPEHQLTTRRLAVLATHTRRTSDDNTPTEWAALHALKPEAMDALFPFAGHNIASVAHEATQMADHLSLATKHKASHRLVARDPAGQVIDFPAAFAVELSLVKIAFVLRKLEFLSGGSPGSLEGLGDAIFATDPSSKITDLKRAIETRLGMPETSLDKADWLYDIDRKLFRLSDGITKKIRAALGVSADDLALSLGVEGVPVPLSEVMNLKDGSGPVVAAADTADSTNGAIDTKCTDETNNIESSSGSTTTPDVTLSPKSIPSSATTPSQPASAGTTPATTASPQPAPRKKISLKDYLAAKKKIKISTMTTSTRSVSGTSRLMPRYLMKMSMRLFAGVGEVA